MNGANPKADWYFEKEEQWKDEIAELRKIVLDCGLTEELKWGCPCYTHGQGNIVLIHVFKTYCALLFFKGALLQDGKQILIQQTANVQSARQARFTSVREVTGKAAVLKKYIYEAIAVEEAGLKVALKKTEDYPVPEEFQQALQEHAGLKTAFEALTPGRQKAYLFYFAQAKQAKTRMARIEKYLPLILAGKGLND
ncbi:YdeI/OmpD-associated family protein [Taibaiella chishuiensis]|uniref:Uncharacterized protein YdeI (YjbR/CyaY-like superfamily) n=1 Tax=Taibaiella chishuiensis TaxID=1434707 RepID=A0A2P8D3D1_9BACT|nr:YdeI/OmpD-associated family protein [Taibaiella chishuiensis]PSK91686.1 uncharacterized protein YdeI (YjbR/CyaY-like superfamily) [Taibaiella chishuiensis]